LSFLSSSRVRRFGQIVLIAALLPLIVVVVIIFLLPYGAYRLLLFALVRILWLPQGKDILLVYSESPIWKAYMVEKIMPLVQDRAEILNWSERKQWSRWSLAVRLFHSYSGSKDFNPMVILFPPFGKARQFRFLQAFKESKHGDPSLLEGMCKDLAAVCNEAVFKDNSSRPT
jgi:hypothetical protein